MSARKIDLIVVHCAATPEGKHFTVADIDGWHRQRGWSGIGYHEVVYLDGSRHKGRAEARVGAHVADYNAHSLGVCYIGGVDAQGRAKDTRTPEQKAALVAVIRDWLRRYPTIKRIAGHNEFAAKACPSFDARAEYAHLLTGTLNAAASPASTRPDFFLRRGSFGEPVREWQRHLRRFAYPRLAADGDFGPATEQATLDFQTVLGITVDGVVGPQARAEMTDVLEAMDLLKLG